MDTAEFVHGPTGYLPGLVVQAVAWAVVVAACLGRVRRPWAWPGLAGGLLGLTVGAVFVVDEVLTRRGSGLVLEHDLFTELFWAQTVGFVLVAMAFVVAALERRRAG